MRIINLFSRGIPRQGCPIMYTSKVETMVRRRWSVEHREKGREREGKNNNIKLCAYGVGLIYAPIIWDLGFDFFPKF